MAAPTQPEHSTASGHAQTDRGSPKVCAPLANFSVKYHSSAPDQVASGLDYLGRSPNHEDRGKCPGESPVTTPHVDLVRDHVLDLPKVNHNWESEEESPGRFLHEDDFCTPRRPATHSFIAVSRTPGQPWELEEGRWIQKGVPPKEELIRVRRTPVGGPATRQAPAAFSCVASSQAPGAAEEDGRRIFLDPHRQHVQLTTLQGQRASRAVAFIAAEQQRRASCSAACRTQPTGYIARHDPRTVTELRHFWEQAPTELQGPSAETEPPERAQHGKSRSAGCVAGERRRRHTSGDTPRSSVSAPQSIQHCSYASSLVPTKPTLVLRRTAKDAFIAPPTTNMGSVRHRG
ncbi:hypothetical protein CSUI_006774 [Cystoisospora suis]|uniref:Uncharacterized protein n=1 Tax=Cystoisospora suis TaxID=483139 RepID=A0A2C6KTB2_9APIC|nr:hypothetical protein CSUI_006774 [Cystoisospora suis]